MTQRRHRLAACAALLALGCSLLVARPHHADLVIHEHRVTDRPMPPAAAAAAATTTTRLHLKLGPTGEPEIPGLYDERDKFIEPIQGKADFQRRVLGLPQSWPLVRSMAGHGNASAYCPTSDERMQAAGAGQTVSLVQFYMATCPDCQGFSPYFKRFARDIGPHWRKLVRVYVVNCNDHQNIHLCQEENPRLIVPMVRWYVLPIVQADSIVQGITSSSSSSSSLSVDLSRATGNTSSNDATTTCRPIKFARALLNVAHRQFIDKQRRDLISLRHATLRLTLLMLDELSGHSSSGEVAPASRDMYHALKIHWRHLPELGHAARHHFKDLKPPNQFARELQWRIQECLRAAHGEVVHQIGNRNQQHNHNHHHGKRAAEQDHTSGHGHHDMMSSHHHEHHHEQHHNATTSHKHHHHVHQQMNSSTTSHEHHDQHGNNQTKPPVPPIDKTTNVTLKHFIIFESRHSFVGRTLVADWSSYACDPNATRKVMSEPASDSHQKMLMMVHRTSDMSALTTFFNQTKPDSESVLVSFELSPISARNLSGLEEIASLRGRVTNFKLVTGSGNEQIKTRRARRMAAPLQPARVQQRASLERYYRGGHYLQRRDASSGNNSTTDIERSKSQAEQEHANWTPEVVYPHEEEFRYKMNRFIAQEMRFNLRLDTNGDENEDEITNKTKHATRLLPGALLAGKHPVEIETLRAYIDNAVDPKTDDLTLMFLTDYYKGLDEIMHTDLMSKGDLDGYQLLASCCFLNDIKRYFPFQGDAHGSELVNGKSRARHYVQLVQQTWLDELMKNLLLGNGTSANGTSSNDFAQTSPIDGAKLEQVLERMRRHHDGCPQIHELGEQIVEIRKELDWVSDERRRRRAAVATAPTSRDTTDITTQLEHVRLPIGKLESEQAEIKKQHDVGLPLDKKLKWYYCAGSGAYLRGHTCSLWVLFHTLTVNEYLAQLETGVHIGQRPNLAKPSSQPVEYKFQIDFAQKPKRPCDPKNPDEAYLATRSSEHHVNETDYVLANIVNFVRYYLPCTNCAAHFSCMVNHSPGLSFNYEHMRASPDSHLLWLWEGHNRVNERTRGTHSEDPRRPKHVFPVYDACQRCYIEKPPSNNATLTERKFNRHELVKFLVARYRKSAILNNKINIELLYKDT